MKKFFFSLAILLVLLISTNNVQCLEIRQLSENSEISLMTCGPGDAIYSGWGHSAFWVYDKQNKIDRIYNYGTFDFSDPDFYYLFLRGVADYYLSVTTYQNFINEYVRENRTVEQQVLNLTLSEKQALFEALEENYKPENRFYRYDFLYLNCSSVVRDKAFESLNRSYKLDQTYYDDSFRDLLLSRIEGQWMRLGVNILLGHKADLIATNWERMFLPDYMRDQFELAVINGEDSLAPEIRTIYLSTKQASKNSIEVPTILLFSLFIIIGVITKKRLSDRRWNLSLDSIIFLISGLIGILLCFMWFFSKHQVVHQNINLLWAFPFHFILIILIWIPSMRSTVKSYSKVFFFVTILFLILGLFGHQEIPTAVYLLAGITMFRLFRFAFFPDIMYKVKS